MGTGTLHQPARADAPEQLDLERLVHTLREAVVAVDVATGQVTLWNRAAQQLLGYNGRHAQPTLGRLLPALTNRYLQHFVRRAAGERNAPPGLGEVERLPAHRADGSELLVELTLTPLADPAASDGVVLVVLRAVSRAGDEALTLPAAARAEQPTPAGDASEMDGARSAALARTGELIAQTDDAAAALRGVSALLVPAFAERCLFESINVDGEPQLLAAAPWDEQSVAHPGGPFGLSEVLRTGEPLLLCAVPEDTASAPSPAAPRTVLMAPLAARGPVFGAVTLVRGLDSAGFVDADVSFALLLGRMVGLALENGRLQREGREAIHVRDEFLASASHELRTPVTTIKAYAQMLEKRVARLRAEDAALLLEGLEYIDDSASRLAVHINQLLDLSRLQTGGALDLVCSPTDLIALARQAAAVHRRLSGRHRIRVKSRLPEVIGNWDGARLERVLGNLLSNAVKFSPEGGEVLVEVDEECGETGQQAVLRVRDHGIGVLESDRERIFERFYRGRNLNERMSGSGIGLASVRQIVLRHGGSIAVDSVPGAGSTFTVCLPFRAGPLDHAEPSGSSD